MIKRKKKKRKTHLWPKQQLLSFGPAFCPVRFFESHGGPGVVVDWRTNPFHYAQDCSHHGQWETLQAANMISIDMDPDEEKELIREYVAMLVESKDASSAYAESSDTRSTGSSEKALELPSIVVNAFACSAHILASQNRNT